MLSSKGFLMRFQVSTKPLKFCAWPWCVAPVSLHARRPSSLVSHHRGGASLCEQSPHFPFVLTSLHAVLCDRSRK
jgi:hypothetical protein